MQGNFMGMSAARVFFGFAVLVAACALLANAIDFDVFDANAFFFVMAGALACCVIGCPMESMRSGVLCLTGKPGCDPVQACGFWTSFGTYAWYCGLMSAFMCVVAHADSIKGAASFDVMLVPAMYCLVYGMLFRTVCMAVASAACGSCVPGGVCGPMNAAKTMTTTAKSGSSKKRTEESVGA